MVKSFLLGAIAGGAVMWLYGDELMQYVDELTSEVRHRAARSLDAAAQRLSSAADTVGDGLTGATQRAS